MFRLGPLAQRSACQAETSRNRQPGCRHAIGPQLVRRLAGDYCFLEPTIRVSKLAQTTRCLTLLPQRALNRYAARRGHAGAECYSGAKCYASATGTSLLFLLSPHSIYGMITAAPSMASCFTAANASLAWSSEKVVTLGRSLISAAVRRKSRASERVMLATLRS
jgi:hypothetical protein